jgi:hypothetical protein
MSAEDLDRMAEDARRTRAQLGGTIDALRRRLDPQTLKRQVNHMMRSTDGSTGLAETLKSNPIPLAMIGVGIGWLVLSGTGGGYGGQVRDWADRNTRGARSRVQHAMDMVSETAHDVSDRATGTLQSMRDRVTGEHGAHGRSGHGGPGDGAPGQGAPGHGAPGHGAPGHGAPGNEEAVHGPTGSSTLGRIRRGAGRSASGLWHLVDDYPLAAGLMGLALGAAIGAAIPSTEMENEWVGDWGDEIRARGSDLGSDLVERGSAVAQAAIHGGVEAVRGEIGHHEGGPDEGR